MLRQEAVVVSSVLFNGTVPGMGEIEAIGYGYGADPGQWPSVSQDRHRQGGAQSRKGKKRGRGDG